jgi:2-C-methyl-D-erythritol 4-phosphate cytidylyltransferase
MPSFALILPAAGSSIRFGGDGSKLLAPLADGLPVIGCTLERFLSRADVELIVIATRAGGHSFTDVPSALDQMLNDPRVRRCAGGPSRAESVRNALAEVPAHVEWVAVHDAARPLVSADLIGRTVEAAARYGAAIPAVPIVPTVKQADGPLPAKVQRTIPRQTLWGVQTPQVMRRTALEEAYAACPVPLSQVTDEAQLLELAGQDVWLVPGDERNIKITTQDDLRLARAYLAPERGNALT